MTTNKRNDLGLLENIEYIFNADGTINWRAMLKPEHLYVNPDFEKDLKEKFGVKSRKDIDITKCDDNQLLVLLEGWRYLLKLRGVRAVNVRMDSISETKAAATCFIDFIPNFENPEGLTWSSSASASLYNVSGSFQLHLEAMAENRAFARCVRAALGVKIYGKDEFDSNANKAFENALQTGSNPILNAVTGKSEAKEAPTAPVVITPQDTLAKLCSNLDKNGSHSFDKIKQQAIANLAIFDSDPNDWQKFDDIPNKDVWTLLTKINQAAASKK